MKIFWSWQSDTPGKIGRFFVRKALEEAIDRLKEAPDIEEPTTKESRETVHLDQDIQGITGSPDLARTIFEKIEASDVVVTDVTLVGNVRDITSADGQTVAGKKLINSNVAIELGYALRARSDRNVLLVFNAHFGTHEDLPFDLRHKGGSIVFNLPPDADRKRIDEERKKLVDRFVGALKPYLQKTVTPSGPFQETLSTFNKAAYFQKGEVLARAGVPGRDPVTFSYSAESLCYVRLIPTVPLSQLLRLASLITAVQSAPLLTRERARVVLADHNEHGAIGYEPASNPPSGPAELTASTQVFQNGEIWSVGATLVMTERDGWPSWLKVPCLPCLAFERSYFDMIRYLLAFAAGLGVGPPWQVEFGLVGIKGLYLNGGQGIQANSQYGPILKSEIVHRMILNDNKPANLDILLLDFFSQIHDSAGQTRPDNLFGFPPHRPS